MHTEIKFSRYYASDDKIIFEIRHWLKETGNQHPYDWSWIIGFIGFDRSPKIAGITVMNDTAMIFKLKFKL